MKNAAVLSVKFHSTFSKEKLMKVFEEDREVFQHVAGLIQKYYVTEEFTGAFSGIYLFETTDARDAFWTSELAKNILKRYGVMVDSLRVEQYGMAIVLNEGRGRL